MAQKSLALVVEGVGSDVAATGGIAWYDGDQDLAGVFLTHEWIGGLMSAQGLAELPESVESTVGPFDVTIDASAFRFVLHGDAVAKQQWLSRPVVADSKLAFGLIKDGTNVFPSSATYTWSAADDGTVIYVGDEAILLGAFSGGNFAGSTRAFWDTYAGFQPRGMSVYRQNPRHENRFCRLLEFNHDSQELSQIWQGFISDYAMAGPTLTIDTIEVATAVQRGLIGRGAPNAITGSRYSNIIYAGAGVERANGAIFLRGDVPKRVNKRNATAPHWIGVQSGGAAFFAQFRDVDDAPGPGAKRGGFAYLRDNDGTDSGGSSPVLGSTIKARAENRLAVVDAGQEGGTREIMLIDRTRDQFVTGLNVAYSEFRGSSRDLKYPHHPVALYLALLTSGYDPDPGEPGSGAAGSFAFGETITFLQTTQYFTNLAGAEKVGCLRRIPGETFIVAASNEIALDTILTTGDLTYGANNIARASGSWITDGVVKGYRLIVIGGTNPGVWTVSADPTATDCPIVETLTVAGPEAVTSVGVVLTEGILTIPEDGGPHLNQWTNGGNNSRYSVNANNIAVAEDTGNIFSACRQSGASISITAKLPKTLLVADWEKDDPGLNATHHDIAVTDDESAGVYTTADNSPQAGLVRFDPSDGTVLSQGSGTDVGTIVAVEILENDGATIIEVNTSDDIAGFTTDLDLADWTIDFLAGTATGGAEAPVNTTQIGTNAVIIRDPTDSTAFWLCPGTGTGVSTFIYKYNHLGKKLAELDMIDHSSIITTSSDDTPYATLDENGDLYVLVEDTATNDMDWVRFGADGARKYSALDDKGVTDIPDDSKSICVGGGGHVFIGNEDPGQISVWSQT